MSACVKLRIRFVVSCVVDLPKSYNNRDNKYLESCTHMLLGTVQLESEVFLPVDLDQAIQMIEDCHQASEQMCVKYGKCMPLEERE